MKTSLVHLASFGTLFALACSSSNTTSAGDDGSDSSGGSASESEAEASSAGEGSSSSGADDDEASTPGSSSSPEESTSGSTSGEGGTTTTAEEGTEEEVTSTTESAEESSESTTDTGGPMYRECDGSTPPSLTLTRILEDLDEPIAAVFPPAQPGVVYVAQRGGDSGTGRLLRIDMETPDVRTEIFSVNVPMGSGLGSEMGFLSFALHPDFDGTTERRLYVSYNPPGSGESIFSEYEVDGDSATLVGDVIRVDQPAGNHNGGHISFGPDGLLYLSLGDGGGQNDTYNHGQNPNDPFAAILRFDPDNLETPPAGNLTSADIGGGEVDERIWHWGLRNPWRFTFDRLTGDLWIGDVGQNAWEELDFLAAGSPPTNFGWPAFEGLVQCPSCMNKPLYSGSTDKKPVHAYGGNTSLKSVTGGYVYRGSAIPDLYGRYVFADYHNGSVEAFTWDGADGICDSGRILPQNIIQTGVASFAEDTDGELYIVHFGDGYIGRIDPM